MLAVMWAVVKHLAANFRHQICPQLLMRGSFAVTGSNRDLLGYRLHTDSDV